MAMNQAGFKKTEHGIRAFAHRRYLVLACRQDPDTPQNEKTMKLKPKSLTLLGFALLIVLAASSQGKDDTPRSN
jgi:magnesium-transporting ATPase (P-type)